MKEGVMLISAFGLGFLLLVLMNVGTVSGATISLTILDFHGNPVPNAFVEIRNSTHHPNATTNTLGQVSFSNMNTSLVYTLTVKFMNVTVYTNATWNYTKHGGNVRVNVFKPVVCAKSSDGQDPVPGAVVKLSTTATDPDFESSQTAGADGCTTFTQLPSTAYTFNVSYRTLGVKVESIDSRTISSSAYQFTFNLALYRLILIAKDADGNPVANVRVSIWRGTATGPPPLEGVSNEQGELRIKLLPSGSYVLKMFYKDDQIYDGSGTPISINSNLERTFNLPLKKLTMTLKSLSGRLASSYTLQLKLYAGSVTYATSTTSNGVASFGHVYTGRSYTYEVLFEGNVIGSGTIDREKIGDLEVVVNIGRFFVRLDDSEILEGLRPVLVGSIIELSVGSFRSGGEFDGSKEVVFDEHPFVRYSYEIRIGDSVIKRGELTPVRNGQEIRVKPDAYSVTIEVVTIDERRMDGTVRLFVLGSRNVGDFNVEGGRASINGLLRLGYRYLVKYMDVDVAEGEIQSSDLGSTIRVVARVGDVGITVYNSKGDRPLPSAVVKLEIARYSAFKVADSQGKVVFQDVPLSKVLVTVSFRGIKVHSNYYYFSPDARALTITGTAVYDVLVSVRDGENDPLVGGELRFSIGDYVETKALASREPTVLELVPNGTALFTVNYLGVDVFEGQHKIQSDGETIDLRVKVYTMRVQVMMQTFQKPVPLDRAKVVFETKGKKVYEGETSNGLIAVKLPAADYLVSAMYLGKFVGSKSVTHDQTKYIEILTNVYEASLKFFKLDGSPLAGQRIALMSDGYQVLEGTTSEGGEFHTFLPQGKYEVIVKGEAQSSYPLSVEGLTTLRYLYIGKLDSTVSAIPIAAGGALLGVSAFALSKGHISSSFRQKTTQRQPRGKGSPRRNL